MKIIFLIYHDVLDDRIADILDELKIDYYTEWENVKGKGHNTDPHLGTRSFPGLNCVRMIAFQEEDLVEQLIDRIKILNGEIIKADDKIRLFQLPLERVL